MEPAFSIWAPVIIAELKNPRHYQDQVAYQIDRAYTSLEDLRIKIKYSTAVLQGKAVEITIKLEILLLVQDGMGHLKLITREETVRDRVPWADFDYSFNNRREAKFIIDINNISWEGGLVGRQLQAAYFIEYALMAVKDQAVRLFDEETTEDEQREALADILHQVEEELARVVEEKEELRSKIFFYERNFNNLKKGVYKLENRNAVLNSELGRYQKQLEQLQEQMHEKERRREQSEHKYQPPAWSKKENKKSWSKPCVIWGNRIKNMFMKNF